MVARTIGAVLAAAVALLLTACSPGDVQKVQDGLNSGASQLSNIPTSVPNFTDLTGAAVHDQLVKQGFQPNGTKTEYTKGAVVLLVQDGRPNKVRLTYPQGTVECPHEVMAYFSLAQLGDSLLNLGYDGVLSKHKGICNPVPK